MDPKAKDLAPKAKAKAKDLGPKAKAKDSRCQDHIIHRSFYIVFNVHVLWVFLRSRILFPVLTEFCQFMNKCIMLLLLMTIDKEEYQTPKR